MGRKGKERTLKERKGKKNRERREEKGNEMIEKP